MKRCERDKRNGGTFAESGCTANGTEMVTTPENEVLSMCAEHALEARRLNHMAFRMACGDANAREQYSWISAAPDRDEYNRRVATLPEGV